MLQIVGFFAAGILVGLLLRGRARLVRAASHASDLCVFFLLFILGLSIGKNDAVIRALPQMGGKAAVLSIGAVAGSVMLCVVLQKLFVGRSR
jgi:uncharacterized membrane protein YbjE (DUF340 family)